MRQPPGLPARLPERLQHNFRYLYWDIGWWGLYLGATSTFLPIYAVRCGATPEAIGLLTALPAAVSLGLSLPAGRLVKRLSAKRATVLFAFLARLGLAAYLLLPWLLPAGQQVNAVLALSVILAIPNTVIGVSFNQFFMEAVPAEWRVMVVGRRNAIMAIVSFLVTLLCGQILVRVIFPAGYQVVFLIGFIGGIATAYQLWRVRTVPDQAAPAGGEAAASARWWRPGLDAEARQCLKVLGLLFVLNLSINLPTPLIPDLLVQTLRLSDSLISIGTATSSMLVFVVSLLIIQMTRRHGNRQATAWGAALLALQTVALALARDPALYLASAVVGGVGTGILGVAQFNYSLDHLPRRNRSAWLARSLLLTNAALLVGALGGPAVAWATGTPAALMLFGGVRVAIGLAILKWG